MREIFFSGWSSDFFRFVFLFYSLELPHWFRTLDLWYPNIQIWQQRPWQGFTIDLYAISFLNILENSHLLKIYYGTMCAVNQNNAKDNKKKNASPQRRDISFSILTFYLKTTSRWCVVWLDLAKFRHFSKFLLIFIKK